MVITEFLTVTMMFIGFAALRIGVPILLTVLLALVCRRILGLPAETLSLEEEDQTASCAQSPVYFAGR